MALGLLSGGRLKKLRSATTTTTVYLSHGHTGMASWRNFPKNEKRQTCVALLCFHDEFSFR